MKCPSASRKESEQLFNFAVGRLRGEAGRELASHVRTCAECSRFVAAQADLWNVLDDWAPEPVSVEFTGNLLRRVDRIPRQMFWTPRWNMTGRWVSRTALPLVFMTVALAAVAFLNFPRAPGLVEHVHTVQPAKTVSISVTPAEADQLGAAFDDLQLLQQFDAPKSDAVRASRSM